MPNAVGDNERVNILKKLVYYTKEIIMAMERWRDNKVFKHGNKIIMF